VTRRLLCILTALVLVAAAASPALAEGSPTEVWVDDDFSDGSCGGHTWGVDAFATIQEGIDAVADGGTVYVAAGAYEGTIEITGRTALTLVGAGKTQTIVRPTTLLSTGVAHKYTSDVAATVFVDTSTGILIQDMTLDGNSLDGDAVVFWNASSGTLEDLVILNPRPFSGEQTGQGIAVDAGTGQETDLLVKDCDISDFNKNGIDAVNGNGAPSTGTEPPAAAVPSS